MTYQLVPESCVAEFAVRHMFVATVRGRLAGVGGTLTVDGEDSWVRVDLDAASIRTGSQERDAALRQLLGTDEHPVVRFESTWFGEAGPGKYKALGDLYVGDAVGEVEVDGRIVPSDDGTVRLAATTTISRRAFGMVWSKALERVGIVVSDAVRLVAAADFVEEMAA